MPYDFEKPENLPKVDFSDLKRILDKLEKQQQADQDNTVPHWSIFRVGEIVVVKGYCFRVAYINETTLVLEPTGPTLVGTDEKEDQDGTDL